MSPWLDTEKRKEYDRNRKIKWRNRLYEILGQHSCIWPDCGIDDPEMLVFDRIYGDAKSEISKFGRSHSATRDWLSYYATHPEEARQRLQVLCYNHDAKKRMQNKEYEGYTKPIKKIKK